MSLRSLDLSELAKAAKKKLQAVSSAGWSKGRGHGFELRLYPSGRLPGLCSLGHTRENILKPFSKENKNEVSLPVFLPFGA